MQITKTKKRKIKKLARKKVAGLHVVSLVIMSISGLFTGGVVLASELHANMTEAELIKLEQKVNDELSDIASQANSRDKPQDSKGSNPIKKANTTDTDEKTDTKPQEISQEPGDVPAQPSPPPPPAPLSTSQASPAPSPPPPPPPAPAALEITSSLNYINSVRSSAGKSALQANSTVNQWALNHALTLANSCSLYHQEISQFLVQPVAGKTVVGVAENVGYASSIPQVLDGLKNSPGHYTNMIGNYTHVGLGVVNGSGGCSQYVYTAQVFVRLN